MLSHSRASFCAWAIWPAFISSAIWLRQFLATSLPRIPSTESPLLRILPGRPSGSYLWHKLQGTQESVGGSGETMPKEGALPDGGLDQIRAWILEGAPVQLN